jgi:hypothetical protein
MSHSPQHRLPYPGHDKLHLQLGPLRAELVNLAGASPIGRLEGLHLIELE